MRFSGFAFLLAPFLLIGAVQAQTPATLLPGSTNYSIYQGDKIVGSAEATISPTASGYTVNSRGDLKLSKFSYSFTNSQNLDHMLNLVSSQITGTVNGSPVTFTVNADPTGRQFNISVNAKGQQTQNTADRHQHLALLPDLDAAGYILLTEIGLENPAVSWALVPKENGLLVPTVYQPDTAGRGRLNGADISVEHTTVTLSAQNAITVELFHSSDGRLLEADLPQQNFYVVLNGFKLVDRPKFAPPHSPEPDAAPGQQQQQGGEPQYSEPQGEQPQVQQQ
jgi:hypothetical protein